MLHPKWCLSALNRSPCSSPLEAPFTVACSSISTLPTLATWHHIILPWTLDFSCTPPVTGHEKLNMIFWITLPLILGTSILLRLLFIIFREFQGIREFVFHEALTYWQALWDKRKRLNICQLLISARGSVGSWISVILWILMNTYKVQILIPIL